MHVEPHFDQMRDDRLDLRFRRPLLHDGSASTIEAAIMRHAGEAEVARRRVETLTPLERQALIAFLKSL